jgi:two-component system, sensor histidine kinase and response regulator
VTLQKLPEEPQLRAIVKQVPVAIAVFGREMRYLAASQLWLENFCEGERKVLGRSHYDFYPEIPQRWKDVYKRALAGETIREDDDQFQSLDGRTGGYPGRSVRGIAMARSAGSSFSPMT